MHHYTDLWRRITGLLALILMPVLTLGASPPASAAPSVLVWGDSLSAAHGIPRDQGWVALLRARLKALGIQVVNASVSGETTQGGLSRLPDALKRVKPVIFILELGANDGLRGLPLKQMQANLSTMIELARAAGAKILLIGMRLPPNYGRAYTRRFARVYRDIADREKIPLLPFLLDGVADDFDKMQADGLHPTAAAQPRLLENVWQPLRALLAEVKSRPSR